jgi:NADH dehydrogenase [ubiquinone] 1 alpha subcomplex assembly factor 7
MERLPSCLRSREAAAKEIGRRITQHIGAALIIDYGHTHSGTGDTLQAIARHQFADVLARPGEADITSHVDFEALAVAQSPRKAPRFTVR